MSNFNKESEEPKVSRDGLIGTIIFHALILLLFVFMGMKTAWPPPEEEGVLINFGTSDYGWGEVQPIAEATPPVTETQPAESQPEETTEAPEPEAQIPEPVVDNAVKTSDDPEAPSLPEKDREKKTDPVKKETKKPKKEPTKPKPKPKPTTKPKPKPEKPKKDNTSSTQPTPDPPKPEPKIDENALFKGSGNNSNSQGNTPGSSGDQGSNMGSVDITPNTGDQSFGQGKDGVGHNLTGRNLLKININDNSQETGTVMIKIKVDRQGRVIDAQFQSAGSTTTNSTLRSKAIAAARKAQFNASLDAPQIQTGTLKFTFRVQ